MGANGLVDRISSAHTASTVERALAEAIPTHVREVMLAHQRDENTAAARRLLAVADCVSSRMKTLRIIGAEPRRARALALSEIAQAGTCTIHTAEVHSSIGLLLDQRLPAIRDAALAGLLDMSHLSTIYRALNEIPPEVTEQVEEDVLAAARHLTPAALAKEIERLLVSVDPDSAERRREVETRRRHVRRYPRAAGMAQVNAYLSADEAIAFDGTLDEIASTVCPFDPRDKNVRRADAILALAAGTDRLACGCGRDDCAAAETIAEEVADAADAAADPGAASAAASTSTGPSTSTRPSQRVAAPGDASSSDAPADADLSAVAPALSTSRGAGDEEPVPVPAPVSDNAGLCPRCAAGSAGGKSHRDPRYRVGDHLRGVEGRRASRVHVYLHADLATIANLAENPAFLTGHGPIGAEYARMLAENAQWQLIVSEATHLADEWTKRHPRPTTPARPDAPTPGSVRSDKGVAEKPGGVRLDKPKYPDDGEPHAEPGPHDDADSDRDVDEDPEFWDFIEIEYEKFLDRHREADRLRKAYLGRKHPHDTAPLEGVPRPAAPTPLRHIRLRGFVPLPVIGDGRLIDTIEARIAEHPALAGGVFPDGRGGYSSPPPGALKYKPRRRVARSVRARDGHCRHPGCTVRADRCEFDHVVPFNHRYPEKGGWTVPENLHCLCKQHHQLKTWGYWSVTVLAGYAELWTSTITGQRAISLPGGFRPRSVGADLMRTGRVETPDTAQAPEAKSLSGEDADQEDEPASACRPPGDQTTPEHPNASDEGNADHVEATSGTQPSYGTHAPPTGTVSPWAPSPDGHCDDGPAPF